MILRRDASVAQGVGGRGLRSLDLMPPRSTVYTGTQSRWPVGRPSMPINWALNVRSTARAELWAHFRAAPGCGKCQVEQRGELLQAFQGSSGRSRTSPRGRHLEDHLPRMVNVRGDLLSNRFQVLGEAVDLVVYTFHRPTLPGNHFRATPLSSAEDSREARDWSRWRNFHQ